VIKLSAAEFSNQCDWVKRERSGKQKVRKVKRAIRGASREEKQSRDKNGAVIKRKSSFQTCKIVWKNVPPYLLALTDDIGLEKTVGGCPRKGFLPLFEKKNQRRHNW